ncbi:MAG: MBL fold metallo-hydrolase [Bacteroidetes bacterium]|nr:MBL fold metallo-hydrolase [Bacteroidota bacterium]
MKITRDNGRVSILDAGTGIRKLGIELSQQGFDQNDLFLAFSHFHWDHIQGFPFFAPAYNPNLIINILALGKDREIDNLEGIFKGQMQPEYFPVPLEEMGARFSFLQLDENEWQQNNAVVKVIKQNHPGGSYGYRLEDNGKSVVICTDLEHGETVLPEIVEFCKGADLLIHEAQYTTEELRSHKGWGHSSYTQAIEVAERACVGQLAITHHDPDHNDDFLRAIEKRCRDRFKDCVLAREGMEVVV